MPSTAVARHAHKTDCPLYRRDAPGRGRRGLGNAQARAQARAPAIDNDGQKTEGGKEPNGQYEDGDGMNQDQAESSLESDAEFDEASISKHKVTAEQTVYTVTTEEENVVAIYSDIRHDIVDAYNAPLKAEFVTKTKRAEGKMYRVRFSRDIHEKRWEPAELISRLCAREPVQSTFWDESDQLYKSEFPEGHPMKRKRRARKSQLASLGTVNSSPPLLLPPSCHCSLLGPNQSHSLQL